MRQPKTKRRVRLDDEARRALHSAVMALTAEEGVRERATDRLHEAVNAGVPVTHLVEATGIPHTSLLRRLGKARR
jgi:hypothetical protein